MFSQYCPSFLSGMVPCIHQSNSGHLDQSNRCFVHSNLFSLHTGNKMGFSVSMKDVKPTVQLIANPLPPEQQLPTGSLRSVSSCPAPVVIACFVISVFHVFCFILKSPIFLCLWLFYLFYCPCVCFPPPSFTSSQLPMHYLICVFPSLLVSLSAFVPGMFSCFPCEKTPVVCYSLLACLPAFEFTCLVIHPSACKHCFPKLSTCVSALWSSLLQTPTVTRSPVGQDTVSQTMKQVVNRFVKVIWGRN